MRILIVNVEEDNGTLRVTASVDSKICTILTSTNATKKEIIDKLKENYDLQKEQEPPLEKLKHPKVVELEKEIGKDNGR